MNLFINKENAPADKTNIPAEEITFTTTDGVIFDIRFTKEGMIISKSQGGWKQDISIRLEDSNRIVIK